MLLEKNELFKVLSLFSLVFPCLCIFFLTNMLTIWVNLSNKYAKMDQLLALLCSINFRVFNFLFHNTLYSSLRHYEDCTKDIPKGKCHLIQEVYFCQCPNCSANPNTITPIWKRRFANGEQPIRGLYRTFFEKFLFKFPFSHKRFQRGQKMYL